MHNLNHLHTTACWFQDQDACPKPISVSVGAQMNAEGGLDALLCLYRANAIQTEVTLSEAKTNELIVRLLRMYQQQTGQALGTILTDIGQRVAAA